ncbi:MAG: hypothetical protein H6Q10_3274 [Acidobacteria bacterium]|nr:hypothetical protein [Acidobacteriota bacterium]
MIIAFLLALVQAAAASQPPGPPALSFSAPRAVCEVDLGKLKGSPSRLSWGAPEGRLYFRTVETDRFYNERARHYLLPLGGGQPEPTDGEPVGSSSYWAWKSGPVAPGVPDLRFDVDSREENKTATGSTKEATGMPNPFRSDPTSSQVASDYASMQRVATTTLRLNGQLIAETTNQPLIPGLTFGWGPAPSGLLAYADGKKRLVVIDRDGRKVEVPGAADVLLPAWSPNGKQIAYLQKKGGKKYAVMIVDVT